MTDLSEDFVSPKGKVREYPPRSTLIRDVESGYASRLSLRREYGGDGPLYKILSTKYLYARR